MSRRRLCLEVLERRYVLTACANPSVSVTANTANEGEAVTLNLSNSIDGDECSFDGYVIFFGDGVFDFFADNTVTHVYVDDDPSGTSSDQYRIDVYGYWSDDSEATTTINVTISNLAPSAANDNITVNEDDNATINVMDNDSDPSWSDSLHVVGYDDSMTTGVVIWDCVSDTFIYDTNGHFDDLALTETAIDRFMYTLADDDGGTSTATVTITIRGQREAYTVSWHVEGDAKEDGELASKLIIEIDPPAKEDSVVAHWTFWPLNATEHENDSVASPSDWQQWSGSVSFAEGEFHKEVSLVPVDDTKVELNEYSSVAIRNDPPSLVQTDDYSLELLSGGNKTAKVWDDEWRWEQLMNEIGEYADVIHFDGNGGGGVKGSELSLVE
jgi:VCBS repeat-containing protein